MTLRVTALIALLAIALATIVVGYRPPASARGRDRTGELAASATVRADAGVPVVLAADHAIESAWWRPDGHLLVLTPEELLEIDPDAPLPARRVAIHHGKTIRGSAAGTFVIERADGWESRDALTLDPLAGGVNAFAITLSDDGRFLATPLCDDTDDAGHGRCRFAVIDVRTGAVQARLPPGRDPDHPGDPGSFAFLSGGVPGSTWAALLSDGELTVVDFTDGTTHLRRKLRRLTEEGRSRELLEIRGKHAYLTSAYGFEVVDLARGLTLVRERDPQADADVTFSLSDDGATVTEASTFAETLVTSWNVPPGASSPRSGSPRPALAEGESPDHRYLVTLHAGTLVVTSLRSGADVLHLGPPADPPVDMFRRLALVNGVPVLRDRKGGELALSHEPATGPDDATETMDAAALEALPAPDDMLFATADARFAYFLGVEQSNRTPSLLPALRVDRRTGATVPVFAAQRSAIAQFADHHVDLLGDEDEARGSIVCATDSRWLPAASCLNLFLATGRFDAARAPVRPRSGDHPAESVR